VAGASRVACLRPGPAITSKHLRGERLQDLGVECVYRRPDRPTFYSKVLGPLHRQLPLIDAVLGGRADVFDAYGLDLLRRHGDERAQRVRVVASTVEAPSAPLVASPAVNAPTRARLTDALFAAHTAPELVATLDELLLARFVAAKPDAFDMMVERQRQAEVAGYPRLA
jgi:hypothetical protein